ncbi:hypothetical protein C942_04267 [Photobacterium marinum]|uniref:Uncharacterized protein n=1 Tax=Photobacterium marinum TaxID=1056511 RepID=L8JGC6_9GAMM|nr:hypothetical protein C942_04267 [Photobacterium marinum]
MLFPLKHILLISLPLLLKLAQRSSTTATQLNSIAISALV